jgi:hypothetical protein
MEMEMRMRGGTGHGPAPYVLERFDSATVDFVAAAG